MSGLVTNPSGGVPPAGSTGTSTASTRMSSSPVTKVGSATASVLTPASSASSQRRSATTETTLSVIPITTANSSAVSVSTTVLTSALADERADVAADQVRPAEVAAQQLREPLDVLHQHRLVEPEVGADRRPRLRGRVRAGQGGHRVARHQPDHQEDQHRGQEQDQQRGRDAPQQVPRHDRYAFSRWISCRFDQSMSWTFGEVATWVKMIASSIRNWLSSRSLLSFA